MTETKYVFITGGVMSGIGKGIVSASTGLLLKSRGYKVGIVKVDPYLNVDAGTMNPYAHGEVYVTEDGGETDLDLGHYERFLGENLSREHNITTGQVYLSVINKERKGEYLGKTVQIIPHVTDEIKQRLFSVARETGVDVLVVEIGGTVGDIEGLPFLEAARQMYVELGSGNVAFVHVALAPVLSTTGEQKTKPVQHSVYELRRIGIQPNILVVRSPRPLEAEARQKIALFANLSPADVIGDHDVDYVYEVPLLLESQGYASRLISKLGLQDREPDLESWKLFVDRLKGTDKVVHIAMVGKYTKLKDSYLSIVEALRHAGVTVGVKPNLVWVEATDVEEGKIKVEDVLSTVDGAVILPGFGKRGAEGKVKAIRYLRESNIPTLGICFGLQLSIVEFARDVIGLENANSTEIDPSTPHPVVDLLPWERDVNEMGGTLRLGASEIRLVKGTQIYDLYGRDVIYERHRHRYEVNPKYVDRLVEAGLIISAWNPQGLVEGAELPHKEHRFFLGTQAHPEFKSRPLAPSPPYVGLLRASTSR